MPAILGPRQASVSYQIRGFLETFDHDGRMYGVAAEYQRRGHKMVGFNTDAVGRGGFGPAQEELGLQAAMGVRYGFDNSEMDAVRGVTIVPAMAAGIDANVGSIEVGKQADLIVTTGDPADPRSSVELVLMGGKKVYDTKEDARRF